MRLQANFLLKNAARGKQRGEYAHKAGIELGENGSIFPRPKGKTVSQMKGTLTEAKT